MVAKVGKRSLPRPAGRDLRSAGFAVLAAALLGAGLPAQTVAAAESQSSWVAHSTSPQWFRDGDGEPARALIHLLESSSLDGIDPATFRIPALEKALRAAEQGRQGASARANAMLDRALLAYVSALRRAPRGDWIINDPEAVPAGLTAAQILESAASAPSLLGWVRQMPFVHPTYAGLRRALESAEQVGDAALAERLRINLRRARFLPATGRHILVNTAAQRLYMYEDGEIMDSMKVVVGKPHQQTPMMAAMIKFTALNPYWNVPPDLAAERVAPGVVRQGTAYLEKHGYVVLSDWSAGATIVDPATIDWKAVEKGDVQVRLRQEPGPNNAMGRMKFMFPNPQGIYLHDTPNKELLSEEARLFSGGCVRLEDAPRLARWLYGKPLEPRGAGIEEPVRLEKPVAVYLIYQTAVPTEQEIVLYDDIYGRDQAVAASSAGRAKAR